MQHFVPRTVHMLHGDLSATQKCTKSFYPVSQTKKYFITRNTATQKVPSAHFFVFM